MAEHDIPVVLGIFKAVLIVFVIVGLVTLVAKNFHVFG